ncbi:hypothetical protein GYH30_019917 [Glycine max]|nr:hypothetical protein GYH30_019917 [Glycine max]
MFSNEIIELIKPILPPSDQVGPDRRLWPGNRQANKVADAIANRGIGTEEEFLLYEQQPDFLDLLLLRMFWDFNLPEL